MSGDCEVGDVPNNVAGLDDRSGRRPSSSLSRPMPAAAPPGARKTAEPATRTRAPASTTSGAVCGSIPPSTSSSQSVRASSIIRRTRRILGSMPARNSWPPKPGLTVITSTSSRSGKISSRTRRGRRRVDRHAGPQAQPVDLLHRPVQVDRPFLVDDQRVGPGLGERRQVPVGLRDHQVNFQGNRRHGPEPAHDHGPERDIGDEVPVHDVDVNPVGAGRDGLGHLVGQMGHVGRQDRWGELDAVGKYTHESQAPLLAIDAQASVASVKKNRTCRSTALDRGQD